MTAPALTSENEYKALKGAYIMEPIITAQDIINTYSAEEQFSCKKYFEYEKLIKENPTFGYKRAAKLLGIKEGMARWWHTRGAKRAIPLPLKAVEKLKSAGLLPFYENHKDAEIIFNILGTLFGDGGIDVRFNTVAFISSDKNDVDLWHSDLLRIFPSAQGKTQIVEGGEYGHSYNIRCYGRSVVRFFAALGTPVGNKVTNIYTLPKWLVNSSQKSRVAFLDGYLASEVSVPSWRPDSHQHYRFQNFALGISKIEFLEKEHIEFMESVESLLESVDTPTTNHVNKCLSSGNHRKDGAFSVGYRIFIRTNFDKVLFFNDKFTLRYAKDKKERFERVVNVGRYHKNGWELPPEPSGKNDKLDGANSVLGGQ